MTLTLYCDLSNNANEKYLKSELNKISEWLTSNKLSLMHGRLNYGVSYSAKESLTFYIDY